MSIVPIPIANGKEVAMLQLQQVWVRQVRVLIDLVRVVGRDASLRRKRKLRHHIGNRARLFY